MGAREVMQWEGSGVTTGCKGAPRGAAMGWEGAAMSLQWVRCKGGMLGTYGGVQSKYSWGARGVQ